MKFNSHQQDLKEKMEMKKQEKVKRTSKLFKQLKEMQDSRPKHSAEADSISGSKKENKEPQSKNLRSELKKLQKKYEEQKRLNHKLRKEIGTTNEKATFLKRDNWELKQKLGRIENSFAARENELITAFEEEKVKRELGEKVIEQLEAEKRRKQKNGNRKVDLAHQVKQLKESNQQYRHKLQNYDLLKEQEYGDMRKDIEKLSKELDQYKLMEERTVKNPMFLMKFMKTNVTKEHLPDLLKLVESFITLDNIRYFYRGRHNVFYIFMRRVGLLSFQIRKHTQEMESMHPGRKERLGHLVDKGDQWVFVDSDSNEYLLKYPLASDMLTMNERPVKAILEEGEAILTEHFNWVSSIRAEEGQPTKGRNAVKQRKYANFGNYNVLIIGSRFLSDYKHRLEMHGCNAVVHNPYEESYEMIAGKLSRADVILVCERHVPHNIWGHVDRSEQNVGVLKNDSKDLIATYAYMVLERCGLL
ncbi:hypothetical protein [Rossellomorea aquimaris]|uniref:hypothetical protein n=1 Tax=Rossellomorea aquimaris TaxID=189382 RepID=UPI0008FC8BEE|nr:hypothetical protein [Rossellomorea aquimaris]